MQKVADVSEKKTLVGLRRRAPGRAASLGHAADPDRYQSEEHRGLVGTRALKERLADGASLECALSLSFFDCASRRFFGGTWIGRPQTVDTSRGSTIRSSELVHWCSRVDDPACVAVIEVVACAKRDGRTVAQYGCGWTYLRLFGEDTPLSIDAAAEPDGDVLKDGSYERRPLYDGTPRKLVVAAAKLNISRQQPKGREGDLARAAGVMS